MAENETHIFKVTGDASRPDVTIDGKPLTGIAKLSVEMLPQTMPVVTLEMIPDFVHIEGEFKVVFTKK